MKFIKLWKGSGKMELPADVDSKRQTEYRFMQIFTLNMFRLFKRWAGRSFRSILLAFPQNDRVPPTYFYHDIERNGESYNIGVKDLYVVQINSRSMISIKRITRNVSLTFLLESYKCSTLFIKRKPIFALFITQISVIYNRIFVFQSKFYISILEIGSCNHKFDFLWQTRLCNLLSASLKAKFLRCIVENKVAEPNCSEMTTGICQQA